MKINNPITNQPKLIAKKIVEQYGEDLARKISAEIDLLRILGRKNNQPPHVNILRDELF